MAWQDELSALPANADNRFFCCLAISPSQFRRLLPSKRNAGHASSQLAILHAQATMQYTLQQMKRSTNTAAPMSLIVLIVDAIQKYNYAVFHNKLLKTGKALEYALEEGNRLFRLFSQARARLSPEHAQQVTIVNWNDVCENDDYNHGVRALQARVLVNAKFAQLVDDVVHVFIKVRKPFGVFTEEQRLTLREYVLHELPALARGITYDGHHCPVIVHPVLTANNEKNADQQGVLRRLLHYLRNSSELRNDLSMIEAGLMCEVYDIVMPLCKLAMPSADGP